MAYLMGEAKLEPLRVDFDRRLKLEFHGSDISFDGGLFPYREFDHALELTELGGKVLSVTRRGKNTRHLLVGLLRQSVFGRLAGYENAVRLQLHALAYNIGYFLRTLALPQEVEHWSLTTLRNKLIKIGAKVVRHGRYITFQLAEVAIPRSLFANILRLIDGLRPAPLPP